jgi:hypothetical protein
LARLVEAKEPVSVQTFASELAVSLVMNAFCCGLPGAVWCHWTSLSCDQRRIAVLVSSVPLSETQAAGLPG